MIAYHETGDLFADTCEIVESAQSIAYAAVDTILVQRNWLLGKRIAIECLNENGKADYGKKTMKKLSAELKEKYGKGFDFNRMAQVFRVERNKNFTVMSNHHFKNKDLSLRAKGLLSLMLSLPTEYLYQRNIFNRSHKLHKKISTHILTLLA